MKKQPVRTQRPRNHSRSKQKESTPKYSMRDLHELLDIVIAQGGRQAVEEYLERWLCSQGDGGLQLID